MGTIVLSIFTCTLALVQLARKCVAAVPPTLAVTLPEGKRQISGQTIGTVDRLILCVGPTGFPRRGECHGWAMALAFGAGPFALASNLVLPIGALKAERLLYLPSVGFTMWIALALDWLALRATCYLGPSTRFVRSGSSKYKSSDSAETRSASAGGKHDSLDPASLNRRRVTLARLLTLFIVGPYFLRSRRRNVAWQGPIRLLETTHNVVPRNSHSTFALLCNYGKLGDVLDFKTRTQMLLESVAETAVLG